MHSSEILSIIIYSCKKNADMWSIFLTLFNKYWEDCPYNLILVTDGLPEKYEQEQFKFDQVIEEDASWGKMILKAITAANTPYVMLWMDDYLLCDYVNENDIKKYIDKTDQYNAASLMLAYNAFNHAYSFEKDVTVGIYHPRTAYSVSTQIGIWNTCFLKKHINPDWSAWDFERKGSLTIEDDEYCFLVSLEYYFPYIEGVRRGKWMESGIRLCERNGIKLDYLKRPAMSNWEMAKVYIRGAILDHNPELILKIQNILSR